MERLIHVRDIMTRDVVSVKPDTLVSDVIKLLAERGFNGVPVVNGENELVGLITEYDLLSQDSSVYFSPLSRLFDELKKYREDEKKIREKMKQMLSSQVKDIMNDNPIALFESNTLLEAARLFMIHHRINPIPVTNEFGKLTGILSRNDLIRLQADSSFWKKILSGE